MEAGKLTDDIAEYYSAKVRSFGATSAGVDWNSADGQMLRFNVLLGVIDARGCFSLDDYGCGYGALFDHLANASRESDYLGMDISEAMIEQARAAHSGCKERFIKGSVSPRVADYAVASGTFNVRLGATPREWEAHILCCLDQMDSHSKRGFAFNCLSSYSDVSFRKDYLYYADPCLYFEFCKKHYARNIALLHDYGLYEFTILVRKGS